MAMVERVFSGVQPTGNLHLGNYLGAIVNFVKLQETHNCIYCVVDMHALTQPVEVWGGPVELARNTREVTAAFIASGIDPKKHIVFNQSQVHEHAELAWIFNCVARIGWLNRMTQFKDKAGKDREAASVGLYDYPVLMAADILVYRATHVPVGEDQKQHLELSRDIAQKFNNDFVDSIRSHGFNDGLFFPLPEPVITGPATRVMSLRDGTKKMSKSDASDNSRINLTDDADTIAQKIRKAKTDPEPLPSEEKGLEARPEADNLVGIYAALSGRSKQEVLTEFGGGQFSSFKNALVELCVAKLAPIASEMKRLVADPGHVDSILIDGADRARAIAAETMKAAKDIVGFIRTRGNSLSTSSADPRRRLSRAAASWQHAPVWQATGTCMTTQRRSYETGHTPKCLVIVDDTAEWDRAVYYASRWAIRVGGGVVMLRVIEIEDQNQQWLGVADIMRAEAEDAANEALDRAAGRANGIAAITPERVIREGDPTEQILDVIDKDVDIAMLVLAANPGPEGPGPLISMMAQAAGSFPIPVTIVPGDLSDADIDGLS